MKAVIGLEIHVQLNTQSKLFCSCSTKAFGAAPNSNVCPVCVGDPGVLPAVNGAAVERLIQMALALNCKVSQESFFARKNYFYPDLPKNYQISQYEEPFATAGFFDYISGAETFRARLTRVHLEEDAGKLLHAIGSEILNYSLVDFNRTGIPLAEVVTEPDFSTPSQASDFLLALRTTLRSLGVSSCDMEKGEMRVDVNVSLADDKGELGIKVEIKNLNSFKAVRDALSYEIARQENLIGGGQKVVQETRLWDAKNGKTEILRSKEEASDYRYFQEPDLVAMAIDAAWLERLKENLPQLPMAKIERFQKKFGLGLKEAQTLAFHEDPQLGRLFDETAQLLAQDAGFPASAKMAANWILNDLMGQMRAKNKTVESCAMTARRLADFVRLVQSQGLTSRMAKDLFAKMVDDSKLNVQTACGQTAQVASSDEELLVFIRQAVKENPRAVCEYKAGKEKAIQALIGIVMRKTSGQAHPQKLQELLRLELSK